jgi:hypothetical protein
VPCGAKDQREFGYVILNHQNRRPVDCSFASRFDIRLPRPAMEFVPSPPNKRTGELGAGL